MQADGRGEPEAVTSIWGMLQPWQIASWKQPRKGIRAAIFRWPRAEDPLAAVMQSRRTAPVSVPTSSSGERLGRGAGGSWSCAQSCTRARRGFYFFSL